MAAIYETQSFQVNFMILLAKAKAPDNHFIFKQECIIAKFRVTFGIILNVKAISIGKHGGIEI